MYKKTMLLMVFVLALGISQASVYAQEIGVKTVIDLQSYVSCDYKDCSLIVNLNSLPELKKADSDQIKANKDRLIDYAPGVSENDKIRSFETDVKSDVLEIHAEIEPGSSNYFTIEIGDTILDPFFNSTYSLRQNQTLYNSVGIDITAPVNVTFDTKSQILGGNMTSDCIDLIIVDENNDLLCYEVENCNSEFTTIWILPTIKADNSTIISILYNAPNETLRRENASCVWQNYSNVYHFSEGLGSSVKDSKDDSDLSLTGGYGWLDGWFGNATAYDGSTGYAFTNKTLSMGSGFTFELISYWINSSSTFRPQASFGTNSWSFLSMNYGSCNGKFMFLFENLTSNGGICETYDYSQKWTHILGKWNTTYADFYINNSMTYSGCVFGGPECSQSSFYFIDTDSRMLSRVLDLSRRGGQYSGMYIDEVRLSKQQFTDEYKKIQYDYAFSGSMSSGWTGQEYSPPEPPAPPPSALPTNRFCSDDNTLRDTTTITFNAISYNITEDDLCAYGCDNVTFTCNPAPYVQDLLEISIIAMFFIALIIIGKRLR